MKELWFFASNQRFNYINYCNGTHRRGCRKSNWRVRYRESIGKNIPEETRIGNFIGDPTMRVEPYLQYVKQLLIGFYSSLKIENRWARARVNWILSNFRHFAFFLVKLFVPFDFVAERSKVKGYTRVSKSKFKECRYLRASFKNFLFIVILFQFFLVTQLSLPGDWQSGRFAICKF